MAFLTKKEFSFKAGMTVSNLGNYIKRHKIAMSGEYIDDTIEPNKSFLVERALHNAQKKLAEQKAQGRQGKMPPLKKLPPEPEPKPNDPPNIGAAPKQKEQPAPDFSSNGEASGADLTVEKLRVDIERIKSVEQLNQIKIMKQQGELIPTSLVTPLIAQLSMAISSSFKNATETMIVEFGHRKKMSATDVAELRERLTYSINETVKSAIQEAKQGTKQLSEEFKLTRGVGERN
mgnify:FL=1